MNAPAFAVTAPLSSRLLWRILLLSLALTMLLAGLRAWWEYAAKLKEAEGLLDGIVSTQGDSLSNSLWAMDTGQLVLQLEGIARLQGMRRAAVIENSRLLAESGAPSSARRLHREAPLVRDHGGKRIVLGTLVLEADLDLARAQALRAAAISIGFSVFLAGLVSLAIFLLTRSMVSRHLVEAARHFQDLDLAPAGTPPPALRLDKRWAGDELDILALAVNHMQERVGSSRSQAEQADRQARSLARFPEENPSPVLRVDAQGTLCFANQASACFLDAMGRTIGQRLDEPFLTETRLAFEADSVRQFSAACGKRSFAFAARPVVRDGYVNLYGMDVTEREEAMAAMARSLAEKEILLKEIHHRVKNNLQIVSSLLFLQMEYVSTPRDRELFAESQKRIQAMALVHEELYGAQDLSSVNMADYAPRLVERVLGGADAPVRLECDVADIRLPVTRSIPCGLILNELTMNAVKHAFRIDKANHTAEGVLRVSLRRKDGRLALEVADNGPGLPTDFDISASPSLGMTLVSSLTEQLDGTIAAGNAPGGGAVFRLEFPDDHA
ncbi:Two-component sensor histidine kinase, contains HisKA and HATPase domains [Humidesulfovibrio mexicanus]|uniref:histidine kinase n=1 Tax=Humidesulfovibrio mexicanus TaxID=147047 RepID=A0A239C7L9_9BACT|nr:histidine kinase dimerization/phosphoacceptor domain -containing protein [Humidesulfovibrio mexicanus]SNS15383.1 Two-component sensor histidine kinase, contains HisKA and HATPase domains [Humidesulfovibrio mexicanus]